MRIGQMVAGLAMVGAGVAAALYLPGFLEKDAANFAASSNDVYRAADAVEGGKYIFHGTIAAGNKEFEKGLVIGTKSVWQERDRLAAKTAQSREDKQRARAGWRTQDEYTQVLKVDLDTGAAATLRLDSIRIEGEQKTVEEEVGGKKYQWQGIGAGTEVSVRASISDLEPLELEQTRGQSLHVGKPSSMVEGDSQTTASVSKWTYIGGLGFAGLGGLVFLLGVFLRRSS